MMFKGIIVTGTRASGKTTVVRSLLKKHPLLEKVIAVTTRKKRESDPDGDYKYITKKEFNKLIESDSLIISDEYHEVSYGIEGKEFQAVIDKGKIPILVITPRSAYEYEQKNTDDSSLKPYSNLMSVFLDAPDIELDKRIRGRDGDPNWIEINRQRQNDREYASGFLYTASNIEVKATVDLIYWWWKSQETTGILSHRIIKSFMDCGLLVTEAIEENISGASYDLRVGDEIFYNGRIHHLSDQEPFHLIEPYDYVIVTSHERANFPKDIAGRFDLAVGMFFQGLILTNGPQVDPGFVGPLFSLLFNTSSSPVLLKRGDHFATIEFSKIIEPTYIYTGQHSGKSLLHYLPPNAARGAINDLKKEFEQLRKKTETLQSTTWAMLSIMLAIFALLVAISQ